jgi:DNA modification methylase
MHEVHDESIHLVVTSPPYFNAPFDYPNLFENYDEFLILMQAVAGEMERTIERGRIACIVTDDMLVRGEKYPIVADITRIMMENGFRYRDRIVWVKPRGYTRISRRSGVVLQHPYPMYFYPDNIQESILIFQKGRFDYSHLKRLKEKVKEASKIDVADYNSRDWSLTVWNITNVLPVAGRIEEGIAAFPEEIPLRLIKSFSFVGETVLDPFTGSGTTLRVARQLGRNSIGYEIDLELKPTIMKKLGQPHKTNEDQIELSERSDARKLRTFLQNRVKKYQ